MHKKTLCKIFVSNYLANFKYGSHLCGRMESFIFSARSLSNTYELRQKNRYLFCQNYEDSCLSCILHV